MKTPRRGGRAWLAIGFIVLLWLAVGQPWTIRPLQPVTSGPFDATAYAASVWERALGEVRANAIDIASADGLHRASTSGVKAIAISIRGKVIGVDTSSRVGIATVDATPADGRPDARVQIGPVLRGSSLRDALSFIQFTDFPNQIAFAAVASALNDRVRDAVLANIDTASLVGRDVQVTGASEVVSTNAVTIPTIVPITLTIEGQR